MLAAEDRPPLERPFDALARRPPALQRRQQVVAGLLGVRRLGPVQAALAAPEQEEPLARGGVAVVGAVEEASVDLVAEPLQRGDPFAEIR